jgi:hypothetical protein
MKGPAVHLARFAPAALALALAFPLVFGPAPGSAKVAAHRHLVVVELFTAQGCVSCDKAAQPFADVAETPNLAALTFPVDYWDYLGWRDTLANAAFTERQKAYERRLGLRDVYTPQVVVDGQAQAPGDDGPAVKALIDKARHDRSHGPTLKLDHDGRLRVGAGARPHGGAGVWLIRYDPKTVEVQVKAGDNRGATVSERNVVHEMVRLGAWRGASTAFKIPKSEEDGLVSLVLVQADRGGKIIAARILPAPKT